MAAVLLCVVMAKEPKDAAKVTAATADTAAAAATDNSAEAPQTRAVVPKTQRRAPAAGANFNKHESTHPLTNQNHNFACFTITKGAEAGAGWRAKDRSYCKTAQSCTTSESLFHTYRGGLN